MIEELKKMKISDLVDIDVSRLTSDEVAYVERRLVKEANRRLSRLKKARRMSSAKITRKERKGFTSYKAPKGYKPKSAGSNRYVATGKKKPIDLRNKRIKNVTEVQSFLKKKSTRIRELNAQDQRYLDVIRQTLGRDVKLTRSQMKRVNRLMNKAQELAGLDPTSKKMKDSPRLLDVIIDIVKNRKYVKKDDAEKIIDEVVRNGYEKGQELLNKLNKEDEKGTTLDFDDENNGDDFNY